MIYSKELMVKVSKLYYQENNTQQEVAAAVGLSRQTVGRILETARREGIVQVRILDESQQRYQKMEEKICDFFALQNVVVEPVYDYRAESIRRSLGVRASRYLFEILSEDQTLAVSWGRTMLEVVKAMKNSDRKVDIVQLNGSLGTIYSEINSNELARLLSDKFDGSYYYLPAPGVVDTVKIRDLLLKERTIRVPLERARKADLAAIGVGALDDSLLSSLGFFHDSEKAEMKKKGIVGDICLHMLDQEGRVVNTRWEDRIIGVSMEDLQELDSVIAIAGGTEKVEAIIASLKSGVVNVLVTDSNTAELICEFIENRATGSCGKE